MENIYDIIADRLEAKQEQFRECFTVYIPNKDRYGFELKNHLEWVDLITNTLADICGGCTTYSTQGFWRMEDTVIKEDTIIAYSYILDQNRFINNLHRIKKILHDFGRRTNQEVVAVEYDTIFYTIYF